MKTYKIKTKMWKVLNEDVEVEQEVSIEEIRKLLKENPELLTPIEEKKTKFFKPEKEGKAYYYPYPENANVINRDYLQHAYDYHKRTIERGVYATREEAELADQKRMAIVRLWNYADSEFYFRPDWSDRSESKYYIQYSYFEKDLITYRTSMIHSGFTLPYFKSQEDAEQFIKDNKADLELLFLK